MSTLKTCVGYISNVIVTTFNVFAIMDLAQDAKTEVSDYTLLISFGLYIISAVNEHYTNMDRSSFRHVIAVSSLANGAAVLGNASTATQAVLASFFGTVFCGTTLACPGSSKEYSKVDEYTVFEV